MGFFRKKRDKNIDFDEIFLDSHNMPGFDVQQFEGRLEKTLSKKSILSVGFIFSFIIVIFLYQLNILQIKKGDAYFNLSQRNAANSKIIFADRGIIYDRNGVELAWNEIDENLEFSRRSYIDKGGFSILLGYVDPPRKDSRGFWWQEEYIGREGLERYYDDFLSGENGFNFFERDALGNIFSENIIQEPKNGNNLYISIDSRIQSVVYESIKELASMIGYEGGAGLVMNIKTGEMIVSTSYPEYDSNIMSQRVDKEMINSFINDPSKVFLNRGISGLYSPGSTVKPFVALGALNEGLITEDTRILSTGSIRIPNPYNPEMFTTFRDWREEGHGNVDVIRAIGDSVNTFFYAIGGGYKSQSGLGISKIEDYIKIFGIGDKTGIDFLGEVSGVIPNPEWKRRVFDNDSWRLGDTYNTSIGQYGFQVTPIQMLRAVSILASNGIDITPRFYIGAPLQTQKIEIDFSDNNYQTIKEGMLDTVKYGTGQLMNVSYLDLGAKTGTSQTGPRNSLVNSWVIGFFPYDNPRYAFTVLMERGPAKNDVSASFVMRRLFDWLRDNAPEYLINSQG